MTTQTIFTNDQQDPRLPVQLYQRTAGGLLVPVDTTTPLPVAPQPAAAPALVSAYSQAKIDLAGAGDNNLVAGTALQTIRVFRILLTLAAGTIKFKDGAGTDLTGALSLSAIVLESNDGNPLYITSAGNAFIGNLSGANQLSGTIWYTKS